MMISQSLACLLLLPPLSIVPMVSGFVIQQQQKQHIMTYPHSFYLQESVQDDKPNTNVHTDDEWHPRDPAFTTPQLLLGIWQQIAQATTMAKGVSCLFFNTA